MTSAVQFVDPSIGITGHYKPANPQAAHKVAAIALALLVLSAICAAGGIIFAVTSTPIVVPVVLTIVGVVSLLASLILRAVENEMNHHHLNVDVFGTQLNWKM